MTGASSPPKKFQGKTEQVKKIDNGLQKGSKKKVERGPKIEELREEQDTHRNYKDDLNKDLYKLKKKKAKLQGILIKAANTARGTMLK